MHIALVRSIAPVKGRSRTMQRSDTPPSSAAHSNARPVPDALADFRSERQAPIRPAIARPASRPPDIRRASPARVASAVRAAGSDTRGRLWSFALGSVCGALLCLIVVSWLTASELPQPAPTFQALSEMPPAAEPSIVVAEEHRDPPVVKTPNLTPAVKRTRPDVPRPAVPSLRAERTSGAFVGSLQIDSTPRGARVFLDRQPVGVTPLVLTDLVVGSHAVRLEANGHTPWSSSIRVIANRQIDVSTILAPSLENAPPRP